MNKTAKLNKNKLYIIFFVVALFSCDNLEVDWNSVDAKSKSIIEESEYQTMVMELDCTLHNIFDQWPSYLENDKYIDWNLINHICVNRDKTKFVSALIQQGKQGGATIRCLCGFKYRSNWEFFYCGGQYAVINQHFGYPPDTLFPMDHLEQIAFDEIYKGYTRKDIDKNGKFFNSLFGGSGWGSVIRIAEAIENINDRELFWSEVYMLKVRWRNIRLRNYVNGDIKDYNSSAKLRQFYSAGYRFWNQEKRQSEYTDYFMRTIYEDTGWWEYHDSIPMIDSSKYTYVKALSRWVPNDEMDEVLSKEYDDYLMQHIDEFRDKWNRKKTDGRSLCR